MHTNQYEAIMTTCYNNTGIFFFFFFLTFSSSFFHCFFLLFVLFCCFCLCCFYFYRQNLKVLGEEWLHSHVIRYFYLYCFTVGLLYKAWQNNHVNMLQQYNHTHLFWGKKYFHEIKHFIFMTKLQKSWAQNSYTSVGMSCFYLCCFTLGLLYPKITMTTWDNNI